MQDNEDEPADVQDATPVEETVETGEEDEIKEKPPKKIKKAKPSHKCVKKVAKIEKPDTEADCCKNKLEKMTKNDTMNVKVYDHPPCLVAPKYDNPKRHCLSKKSYIDFLAEPKPRCPDDTSTQVTRKTRITSQRTKELALPSKYKVISNLEERGYMLQPELVDNLIRLIEGEHSLTPEQAEKLFRDREQAVVKCKKKVRRKPCPSKITKKKPPELITPSMNPDAVMCEYMMAEQFVKSILEWKCATPRDDYREISEVVLKRLSDQLQYTVVDNVDRKSQQMRLLADVIGCWICGILMDVAAVHREELMSELRRRLEERQRLLEEMEFADEMLQDGGYDSDDDDRKKTKLDKEDGACLDVEQMLDKQTDTSDLNECTDAECKTEDDEIADIQTDVGNEFDQKPEVEDVGTVAEPEQEDVSSGADMAQIAQDLESLKDKMTGSGEDLNKSKGRLPFLTFVKIMLTIYDMIETEPENWGCDPMENHLHGAIYEKFEAILNDEDPAIITEHVKDVVDVVSGKIAKWLKVTLRASEVCFLAKYPPEVESKEVRDWATWMDNLTNNAEHWAEWLQRMVRDLSLMSCKTVSRGDWYDWTKIFECQSLKWRRYRLEAVHIGHHTDIMMKDRPIVKTGELKSAEYYEKILKEMSLDVEAGCNGSSSGTNESEPVKEV